MQQQDSKQAVLVALNECWTVHHMLRDLLGRVKQDSIEEPEARRLIFDELPRLIHSQEELIEGRIRALGSEMQRQQGAFVTFAERIQQGGAHLWASLCSTAALLCSMHQALLACSVGNCDHSTAVLAFELSNQSRELEHMMWPIMERSLSRSKSEQIIPPSGQEIRQETR